MKSIATSPFPAFYLLYTTTQLRFAIHQRSVVGDNVIMHNLQEDQAGMSPVRPTCPFPIPRFALTFP